MSSNDEGRKRGRDPVSWGGGAGITGIAALVIEYMREESCIKAMQMQADRCATMLTRMDESYSALLAHTVELASK